MKRKASGTGTSSSVNESNDIPPPSSSPTMLTEADLNDLPWDPSERKRISEYHPDQRDEIRKQYLIKGPCQPRGHTFPWRIIGNKKRRFNPAWFNQFSDWLEYSVKVDKAFCLCCYLFKDHVSKQGGCDTFVTEGFNSWNKTERLSLHMGSANSLHNKALKKCEEFMKQDDSIAVAIQNKNNFVKNGYQIQSSPSKSTTTRNNTALLVIDMQVSFSPFTLTLSHTHTCFFMHLCLIITIYIFLTMFFFLHSRMILCWRMRHCVLMVALL